MADNHLSNRFRILAIREILEKYSDEEHYLTLYEIGEYLVEMLEKEEPINSETVARDIQAIKKSGVKIEISKGPNNAGRYKLLSRQFDVNEIRILIDAVMSARFLTHEDSERLVQKLLGLTSVHHANQLKHRIHIEKQTKMHNKFTHYWIHQIHQAIFENKRVSFTYGRYNLDKQIELSNGGANYTVDPYELVWNSDCYYLIGKLQNENEWRHFRVDRIQQMNTLHDSGFLRESFDVTTYLKSLFHMYSGTMRFVRLRLHNHLINVIIDRFGLDVLIKKSGENHFEVMFEAAISTGLIRWVLTWGSDVEVLEPQSLVTNIRDEAGKMFKLYDSR